MSDDYEEPVAVDGGGSLEAIELTSKKESWRSIRRTGESPPLFWPCVGEHPVYDPSLYAFLTADSERNQHYSEALERLAPGRVILDVGSGDCAYWAVESIRAGARRAYAIEQDRFAVARSSQAIRSLGLSDRITILEGCSTAVNLPERVDVCVSEILGEIGSAEGAIGVLNDVRVRMLATHGEMLPYRCDSLIAPVSLPDSIAYEPSLDADAVPYLWKIFGGRGRPFDVRVSVFGHRNGCRIVAEPQIFESLVFDRLVDRFETREAVFMVVEEAEIQGFLLWLSLQCMPGGARLDTLETETNWFPVFFPAWAPSIHVRPGDRIEATCFRGVSDDGIHPDYSISGSVLPKHGAAQEFAWHSLHHAEAYRGSEFYRALFSVDQFIPAG